MCTDSRRPRPAFDGRRTILTATSKLYDADAYLTQFRAQVLRCEPCGGDGPAFRVCLDRTAFYPEGGGQPADRGALGGTRVLDVREEDGCVWHYVTSPLRAGEVVQGDIDWRRRFDHMQQHTGEHILSGVVHENFSLNNVGFHIGREEATVDFDGPLSAADIAGVQERCDQLVWRDVPVTAQYPGPEALAAMEYRSKKPIEGAVRIVTVEGADVCACCGTHVRRTGEVGRVKILSCQSYKGGVRLTFVCGARAAADHDRRAEALHAVSERLCAKPLEAPQAVQRLLGEAEALRRRAAALENRLFERYAAEGRRLVFEEELSPDSLRRLCLALCAQNAGLCAAFCPQGDAMHYAVGCMQGDARAFCRALNDAFSGKGGGSASLCQGSVQAGEAEVRKFFENNAL